MPLRIAALLFLFCAAVQTPMPAQGAERAPLAVLITIDTETSSGCTVAGCTPPPMSGRIYGEHDGQFYGIGLIMDLLEKHGMRGVFFVNAYLDSWYPETEVSAMVRAITSRGHDVQFHAHPEFRCFRRCAAGDTDCRSRCLLEAGRAAGTAYENQLEILREGAANIERWSGRYPLAFRGGALQADLNTIKALRALGIPIDSSLSGPTHPLAEVFTVNQPSVHEGVLQLPLLAYQENLLVTRRLRFMDQESSVLAEQRALLEQARDLGISVVSLLMHSFSFCDPANTCPNERNVARFDALLHWIASQPWMQVMTIPEFWVRYQTDSTAYLGPLPDRLPEASYGLTLLRSAVRVRDGWMNAAFLAGNVVVALVVLLAAGWFARRQWRREAR